ncbi:accessory Sec system glycosyltransferase GtfA [Lactobacillus corticis]|uniref:Poly(Glycerol-phosphate) alpha-glucosyltransferase n=1 Tax=Lactobacillus corticis TaxID=2201249 RepID=A0A916QG01_9LACO|nr:accessory Sec system glycosyltransferase GtfA [Lactobacillus corticis]GFZ26614.1 poly(glycerol-phosphate) alpha-glucosyltransferase [Lactobacillus corticis]
MTIYNFNAGIGWASSGVEYAQAYRAKIFRQLKTEAKFIFTDFIRNENIINLTRNLGFLDQEIIWLYQSFTDFPLAAGSYRLEKLMASFTSSATKIPKSQTEIRFEFSPGNWVEAYLKRDDPQVVERAEFVNRHVLVRKDFFTSGRVYSEYYVPQNKRAQLYLRRFFNQDGTTAFDELIDGNNICFKFSDQVLTKTELLQRFIKNLHLSADDVVILDRDADVAQLILETKGASKVGCVVHAEHYAVNQPSRDHILWNNYYEYDFTHARDFDFFVVATAQQKAKLAEQFQQFQHYVPPIYVVPVGNLAKIRYAENRRPYSLITASRLASEKHLDWLIQAVVKVHATFPQIRFDIYGEGGERTHLSQLIKDLSAESYISLQGHRDLTEVYQDYELYVSASTSEGFGLSLLEAIGSGLAMVGLDVPYGNPTFIQNGKNGVLVPYRRGEEADVTIQNLANGIIQALRGDLQQQHQASYQLAQQFTQAQVAKKWQGLLEGIQKHDKSI